MITLQRNKTFGIVMKCESAEKYKISIKQSGYQLKKIDKVIEKEPFIEALQLKFILWLADYYFASMGQVAKLFIPPDLLKKNIPNGKIQFSGNENKNHQELFISNRRLDYYTEQINSALKNKKQVLFLVPNLTHLKIYNERLNRADIKTIQIHGSLPKRKQFEEWEKIRSGKPLTVIGARSALFYPFNNLGLVIVDEEQNSEYKSWDQSPRYNARDAALKLAEIAGAKIILGTSTPSVESFWQAKHKKYRLNDKRTFPKNRLAEIIDMREEIKQRNYSMLARKFQEALTGIVARKEKAILLINRRGASTFILCRDCGYVVKCSECEAPLVYHLDSNKLLCHHCVKQSIPPNLCPKCSSWRIKYFGTGTQKIIQEIKKLFPDAFALRLDSDIAKKLPQQEKIFEEFIKKDFQILIATQLVSKFLTPELKIKLIGVISIDTSLNMPDWRSGERVFQIISKFFHFPRIMIQTYHPENSTIKYATKDDFESFYKEEIKNRKSLSYPPFSQFIKLTYKHKNPKKAEEEAKILYAKLNQFLITNQLSTNQLITLLGPVPAFIPKIKNHYIWQIIIKLKTINFYPEQSQGNKLKTKLLNVAPSDWVIDVDPENLL